MKFRSGDRVKTIRILDSVIPVGSRGTIISVYPSTHSVYPYEVLFTGDKLSFPVAEHEIKLYVPWYRRLWDSIATIPLRIKIYGTSDK